MWLTCVGDRFACVDTRGTLVYVLIQRTFVDVCRVDWRFSLLVSLGSVLQQWDWDMWMRTNFIRKDRECIIPDISRTFHFGSKGLNMNPYFQDLYFKKHSIVSHAGAVLKDVDKWVTVCVCVWDSVCVCVCVCLWMSMHAWGHVAYPANCIQFLLQKTNTKYFGYNWRYWNQIKRKMWTGKRVTQELDLCKFVSCGPYACPVLISFWSWLVSGCKHFQA